MSVDDESQARADEQAGPGNASPPTIAQSEVLESIIKRRRMRRNFDDRPIEPAVLEQILETARRAPSAGHTQATEFVVLNGPAATARYWDVTLSGSRRHSFRWQGLLRAPVLVLACTRPQAYTTRYSEPDKASTGRGNHLDDWPVPYWWFDAGAAAQNLLLLATANDLGACLFGPFDHEKSLKQTFALDDDLRIAAVVALGYPLPDEDGRSVNRGWRRPDEVIHHVLS